MLETLFSNPLLFIVMAVVILASLSFHEFSHALMGTLQGDDTARRMGRLTLDPRAHVDPLGLVALFTVGFGWGKPVPFNPYNLRDQKWGPVLVAAAGPLSNLLLAAVFAVALRVVAAAGVLSADSALFVFLMMMVYVNVSLCIFNLIPIPPLDGSRFLLAALDHPRHARTRFILENQGPLILLVAILVDFFVLDNLIFGHIFGFLSGALLGLLGVR